MQYLYQLSTSVAYKIGKSYQTVLGMLSPKIMKSCQKNRKKQIVKVKSDILSFFSNEKVVFIKDDKNEALYDLFRRQIEHFKAKNNLMAIVITFMSIRQVPTKIVHLTLNNNQLNSLQTMQRYDMPNLQTLSLNNNQISSIRSLKKCRFPQLQKLKLHNNRINNFGDLEMANFCNLRVLFCHNNPCVESQDNIYMSRVFLNVAKSNFGRLQVLVNQVQLNRVILHNPVQVMLEEKYDGLFINQQLASASPSP